MWNRDMGHSAKRSNVLFFLFFFTWSTFLRLILLYFLLRLDIIQSTYLALYQHSTVERIIEARVDDAHTRLKTLPFSCGQDCELPRREAYLAFLLMTPEKISNSLMTVCSAKTPFRRVLNMSSACQREPFISVCLLLLKLYSGTFFFYFFNIW